MFSLNTFVLSLAILKHISCHGRLMDPPGRNVLWRYGFNSPINYNDNELFCGGRNHQWSSNDGKCGICGDAYDLPRPRPHEAGGTYGSGIIPQFYIKGQSIPVSVELTANHNGYFVFKLCPNNNPYHDADQDCFDKYPLVVTGTKSTKYDVGNGQKQGMFEFSIDLPENIVCSQCVLQWTYYTANNWGQCKNGTFSVACGIPEVFRNCADIGIEMYDRIPPPHYVRHLQKLQVLVKEQVCISHVDRRLNDWCQVNCVKVPRYCPEDICTCPTSCRAVNSYEGQPGADAYCLDTCLRYPPTNCSAKMCQCYVE